jgi:hypothetical protein
MKRIRKFRKLRRGHRGKGGSKGNSEQKEFKILHTNMRGFNSKKESLFCVIDKVRPNCVTINETGLRAQNKVKIPGYFSFSKNRIEKCMGGVATAVTNDMKQNTVKVKEGEDDDEYIIIRVEQYQFPINIVNYYGEQEGRTSKEEILKKWMRLKKDLDSIKARGEPCILIGDFNKHIGCDELGVSGGNELITFGGSLVRDLLATEDYILINNSNKTTGGPFTRFDPAGKAKKSCLEFVIVSAFLEPFVKELIIDSSGQFPIQRVVTRAGKLKFILSDHYTLIFTLSNLQEAKKVALKTVVWNTMKPNGWEKYAKLTDEKAREFDEIIEDTQIPIEKTVDEFEKKLDKIKFASFGKTTLRKQNYSQTMMTPVHMEPKELLQKQSDRLEKEINDLKEMNIPKGSQIFKIAERIRGPKGGSQEPSAVRHPTTGEVVVSTREVKEIVLEYCSNVLENNEPKDSFKEEIALKEMLHDIRVNNNAASSIKISEETFNKVMEKTRKGKKKTYDFLMKAGNQFKQSVHKLCSRMIQEESFPSSFDKTNLVQIYKGKGPRDVLSNSRFVHTKEWLPRTCESLIVAEMKDVIFDSSSKFQIGGQPNHRIQEHLFTMRSIIALYDFFNITIIFQLYDIQKFFDKENLRDVMDTLNDIGVDPKLYRTWYLLNKNTTIRVKTGNGFTEWRNVGEILGQGSGGGAMASAANLDRGVDLYFEGSKDEAMYGDIRLQPVLFMDDLARVTTSRNSAQVGNIKLDCLMNTKQLSLHPDKTGFIVFGKGEQKEKLLREISKQPITCGDFQTNMKIQDKWLGDMFNGDGLAASVQATIQDRTPKVKAAIFEIKGIIEDFRSQCMGGAAGALELWELSVIPMLLNNAGTWTEISESSIEILDELQNMFVRVILHLPVSTPKPVLTFDTGLLSMRHRIMSAKLNLAHYLHSCGDDNLAGQVYSEQLRRGWPGLCQEVAIISTELGLQNVNNLQKNEISKNIWKNKVNRAVRKHNELCLKEKMGEKLQDIKSDSFGRKQYLEAKSIETSRMTIRIRSKMVQVKENFKNMYKNKPNGLKCDSCLAQVETQAHVVVCPAYDKLREGLTLTNMDDLVKYYREVLLLRDKKTK